jgi:hypothetical protein
MFFIVISLFTILQIKELAIDNANKIKKEGIDYYQISYSSDGSGDLVKTLELLGSTSRFIYFYDHKSQQSIIISPENISYMSKQAKLNSSHPKLALIQKKAME